MKTKSAYQEAMRYIENAKETLKLAGKDGQFFADEKYVKTASGIAGKSISSSSKYRSTASFKLLTASLWLSPKEETLTFKHCDTK